MVKNSPGVLETGVLSLGWEDPLEEGMATHSSVLAWRFPIYRGAWQATVHGVTKSDTTARLSNSTGLVGHDCETKQQHWFIDFMALIYYI